MDMSVLRSPLWLEGRPIGLLLRRVEEVRAMRRRRWESVTWLVVELSAVAGALLAVAR